MSRRTTIALAWGLAFLPLAATAAPADIVVPNPAALTRGTGEFSVTPATPLLVERDEAGPLRVATNFAALASRSLRIKLRPLVGATRQDAIRFERVADLPGGPEAYRVAVKARSVVLTASTDAGFTHATTTLWQLMAPKEAGRAIIPAVTIDDAPRFAWRGLMLDSARHYQSPRFIASLIDWMWLDTPLRRSRPTRSWARRRIRRRKCPRTGASTTTCTASRTRPSRSSRTCSRK